MLKAFIWELNFNAKNATEPLSGRGIHNDFCCSILLGGSRVKKLSCSLY